MEITRQLLLDLQKQFGTDTAIGKALGGLSRQAVQRLRKKHAVPPLPPAARCSRHADMMREHVNGVNGAELALKYGLSLPQTYRILRSHKKPAPP